ncbi:hypothetical protein OHU11_00100 [Streptomyces sp. NBC_00257]|uniref:hypothetical protein n=1 Tax=unclassified Streptomyces TaxID=2593676 RepID=UPI00225457C8|nr:MULTISPECIES: hypothetical protein [unclassified Streptomyces]MCX4869784.1 hypothetical protein [Streptomyces sp. NBC_00906]MCX4900947.1 hypothetical protein [Streptomyces sp. NBC_00892]MCX5426197.1 hypothetical protein [Streptomyces sp. NBC_00062]
MDLVIEEAAVTVKVLSVGGRQMSKAVYSQLAQRPFLNDRDCAVQGRLWGTTIEPKCCHRAHGREHWHVVYEHEGELAVWRLRQGAQNAPYNLVAGGPYEPASHVDGDFLDACALDIHRGFDGFFQGQMFDLIRDEQIVMRIEETEVCLTCSAGVLRLRTARKEHAAAEQRAAGPGWPTARGSRDWHAEAVEKARHELKIAEEGLARLCEQRERSARDLYADLVADVRRIKLAPENYGSVLEAVEQLPQLFLSA